MKKGVIIAAMVMLISACGSKNETVPTTTTTTEQIPATSQTAQDGIDRSLLPLVETSVGEFPFFAIPAGYKLQNKPLQSDFSVAYFPLGEHKIPLEGKLYKANIIKEGTGDFSAHHFEKVTKAYWESLGARLLFEGSISQAAYDQYGKVDPHAGDQGDLGYPGDKVIFYGMRTKEHGNVFVQFCANSAAAKLAIIQEPIAEEVSHTGSASPTTQQ